MVGLMMKDIFLLRKTFLTSTSVSKNFAGTKTGKVDIKSNFMYNTCIDDKELDMQYTLITKSGKIMQFYIKALAESYQAAYGGIIVTADIFYTEKTEV